MPKSRLHPNFGEPTPDESITNNARDARRRAVQEKARSELSRTIGTADRRRQGTSPSSASLTTSTRSGWGHATNEDRLSVDIPPNPLVDSSDEESHSSVRGAIPHNSTDALDELYDIPSHSDLIADLPSHTWYLTPPPQPRESELSTQFELLDLPRRSSGPASRSHVKYVSTPNLSLGATDTPINSFEGESSRGPQTTSMSFSRKLDPTSIFVPAIPHADSPLSILCSQLLLRLSQLRGFGYYFSLLSSLGADAESSDDPIGQVRDLFSLGIPLCFIFDLLPTEEGYAKINMSKFNTEGFAANPMREKNRAIMFFIMRLSSEKVRQTLPGCVPFFITDISGTSKDLAKVVNTVNAIIDHLPSNAFSTQSRASSPDLSSPESGYIYGLMRPTNPLATASKYQIADAALNHARVTEHLISDVLARSGMDGLYYIQVGFNEQLIASGQGALEEIYIYTDSEFRSDQPAVITPILTQLSQILSPFPGFVHTPQNTYHIFPHLHRGELSESELWFISKMTGVFREGLGIPNTTVRGGGPQDGHRSTGGSVSRPQGQANNVSGKGKGRHVSRDNTEEEDFEGDQENSGDGGRGEDTPTASVSLRSDHGPKNLSIPFHSRLVIKDDKREVLSQFTASATVNMKLTENVSVGKEKIPSIDSDSHADGWFGPWFSIQLPFIQTNSTEAISNNVRYNMNMAQVRVVASSCLSSLISFSPGDSYSIEDPMKVKSERNYTGGGWATISGTPSMKIGGSASQTTGQETSQKKWEIFVSPSSGTKTEKSITWKYVLNDKYYKAQSTATFDPGPSVKFGHKLYARRPCIEVELVVYWSATLDNTRPRLRHWFSGYRSKENPQPPSAFTNLLHQVSVSVDLENLDANAWVVGLNTDLPDEESLPGFQGLRQFEPIHVTADSTSALNCEVTLQRALHGRIQLNKNDNTSDKPLLPPLFGSSANVASPQETPSHPILPTPPRSPVHTH